MSPVASVQRCLITPPRPTLSAMKITFTPGSVEPREDLARPVARAVVADQHLEGQAGVRPTRLALSSRSMVARSL